MGIAPMQISASKIKRFPVKVLSFLSSGISPRCNFIVHESLDKIAFFEYLFRIKGWDLIITTNIESELNITKAYIEYLKDNNKMFEIEPGFMSPYLTTDTTYDIYWKGLSRKFREILNNRMNRLNRNESFKLYRVTDYEQLEKIIDKIVETSANSWKGDIDSDLKSNTDMLSFYIDFSRSGSDLGLFELWILELDGVIASFDYCLKSGHSLSGIRSDFDLEYKNYDPGKMLKLFIIKDLFTRKGVWEYDLGGNLGDHKVRWTVNLRKHSIITAAGPGHYGKLLMLGKLKLLPLARKWRRG